MKKTFIFTSLSTALLLCAAPLCAQKQLIEQAGKTGLRQAEKTAAKQTVSTFSQTVMLMEQARAATQKMDERIVQGPEGFSPAKNVHLGTQEEAELFLQATDRGFTPEVIGTQIMKYRKKAYKKTALYEVSLSSTFAGADRAEKILALKRYALVSFWHSGEISRVFPLRFSDGTLNYSDSFETLEEASLFMARLHKRNIRILQSPGYRRLFKQGDNNFKKLQDAELAYDANAKGYDVIVGAGYLRGIVPAMGARVQTLAQAEAYVTQLAPLRLEVENAGLKKGFRINKTSYSADGALWAPFQNAAEQALAAKAVKKGLQVRIREGKVDGVSPGQNMWFESIEQAETVGKLFQQGLQMRWNPQTGPQFRASKYGQWTADPQGPLLKSSAVKTPMRPTLPEEF